jgi:hypothetical protein
MNKKWYSVSLPPMHRRNIKYFDDDENSAIRDVIIKLNNNRIYRGYFCYDRGKWFIKNIHGDFEQLKVGDTIIEWAEIDENEYDY